MFGKKTCWLSVGIISNETMYALAAEKDADNTHLIMLNGMIEQLREINKQLSELVRSDLGSFDYEVYEDHGAKYYICIRFPVFKNRLLVEKLDISDVTSNNGKHLFVKINEPPNRRIVKFGLSEREFELTKEYREKYSGKYN